MMGVSTMNWKKHTPGKLNMSSFSLLPFYMIKNYYNNLSIH